MKKIRILFSVIPALTVAPFFLYLITVAPIRWTFFDGGHDLDLGYWVSHAIYATIVAWWLFKKADFSE